jgi:hypothetical protein
MGDIVIGSSIILLVHISWVDQGLCSNISIFDSWLSCTVNALFNDLLYVSSVLINYIMCYLLRLVDLCEAIYCMNMIVHCNYCFYLGTIVLLFHCGLEFF